HELDVEVPLAEDPPRRLPHRRERLGEQVVEVLALVEPSAVLAGERAQLRVGARLHLRLEPGNLRDDGLEQLELASLAGVEELLEESHRGESTGDPVRNRTVRRG